MEEEASISVIEEKMLSVLLSLSLILHGKKNCDGRMVTKVERLGKKDYIFWVGSWLSVFFGKNGFVSSLGRDSKYHIELIVPLPHKHMLCQRRYRVTFSDRNSIEI